MKITSEDIKHVAELARLNLDDDSIHKFSDQISIILEYIEKLNQVDTTHIAPTTHAISLTNAFREDVIQENMDNNSALANAPEKEDRFFIVPKIVN